jgi:Fe2+ transport system protein B
MILRKLHYERSRFTGERFCFLKNDRCYKYSYDSDKVHQRSDKGALCISCGLTSNYTTHKIDRIVTNRILGIPIFIAIMWLVYYVSVTTVGTFVTDWTNDVFVVAIQDFASNILGSIGAGDMVMGLVVDGIIGGLGAVLGFVPQMAILFLFLSILEDCGYMVRIAFVMDRVFRHFGLSGKSFIPLLISSGCGIPGIMASKTIEQAKTDVLLS